MANASRQAADGQQIQGGIQRAACGTKAGAGHLGRGTLYVLPLVPVIVALSVGCLAGWVAARQWFKKDKKSEPSTGRWRFISLLVATALVTALLTVALVSLPRGISAIDLWSSLPTLLAALATCIIAVARLTSKAPDESNDNKNAGFLVAAVITSVTSLVTALTQLAQALGL